MKDVKIRVLTAKNGFKAGQVVDMDDADGARWLGTGDGEKVNAKAGQAAAETASADPGKQTGTGTR